MYHSLPGPGDFDPPDLPEDDEEYPENEPDYDGDCDCDYDNPADDFIMTEAEKRGQL